MLNDMGIAILGGTADDGRTGSGLLATVTFTARASGTTPITLTDVVVADASDRAEPLPVALVNAQVTVR